MSTNGDVSNDGDTETVTLQVDADRCIGAGMCELLEADLFLLNDDTNIAGVVGDGQLPNERALVVIDRCPAGAISIVDPLAEPATEES